LLFYFELENIRDEEIMAYFTSPMHGTIKRHRATIKSSELAGHISEALSLMPTGP
jgi:hypothetical protein